MFKEITDNDDLAQRKQEIIVNIPCCRKETTIVTYFTKMFSFLQ